MNTSLKYLMANCTDFFEEESLLQSMGPQMGGIIDRTPKCHPKLVGEGIEYSWACAKNKYRLLCTTWRVEEPRQIQRVCKNLLIKNSIDKRIDKEKFKEGS
jgi:hypothetical protein